MIGLVIEGLVASAVLMALVLAIRGPVRRAFGADVAYALWALPVLRLALPPLPHAVPQAIRQATIVPVAQVGEPVAALLSAPVGGAVQVAASGFEWALILPALAAAWLVGALAFAGFHILSHRRFCRDLLVDAATLEARDGIAVIETPRARGPLAFGIVHRYVAFPADFSERYDDAERDLALAHELGHHARGDLIANWIALAVLALHWFNPIAWVAFRAFRTDQEVANDARVLAGRPAITRHTYACAILKAAHGGAVSAACHLHTIDDLKGRLRMLTTRRISRARLASGAATVLVVSLAALGLTASGTQAAEHVRAKVRTVTGVDLASFDERAMFKPIAPVAPIASIAPIAPIKPMSVGAAIAPVPPVVPVAPMSVGAPLAPVAPIPPLAPIAPGTTHVAATTEKVVTVDGRETRRHLTQIDDGIVRTDDRFATLPRVVSTSCGTDVDRPLVVHDTQDGRRRITVCNDRIEKAAAHAEVKAAQGEAMARVGYQRALVSLRNARANVSRNAHMPEDARRDALASIDQSMAEMEADIARAN